jgi:hypothetical protein
MHQELCTTLCITVKAFTERVNKRLLDAAVGGFLAGAAVTLLGITLTSL